VTREILWDQNATELPGTCLRLPAEVVDLSTQKSISAQVSEPSLYGCFIELTDPFPAGAQILVKIFSQGQYFEGPGTVMHATPNGGVGVSFHDGPRQ
jgi:hypothetical protein